MKKIGNFFIFIGVFCLFFALVNALVIYYNLIQFPANILSLLFVFLLIIAVVFNLLGIVFLIVSRFRKRATSRSLVVRKPMAAMTIIKPRVAVSKVSKKSFKKKTIGKKSKKNKKNITKKTKRIVKNKKPKISRTFSKKTFKKKVKRK